MKIGIVGTGAVGGFIGAKLALDNHEVVFLSRGRILKEMQKKGLKFDSQGKIELIRDAIFTEDAKELESCELIFFTVKSYDTESAALQIKDYVSKDTVIITPQNGIHNDVILGEIFNKKKIIPGMAKVGVSMPEPGCVDHSKLGVLTLGEYSGKITERIREIKKIIVSSGIKCIISKNIQEDRWGKYIWNCTFNIIAAITELNLSQILDDVFLRKLAISTMKEIISVAKAKSIKLNEKMVISKNLDLAENLGEFEPSTLEDVRKGKPIELDAFTGRVIKYAEKLEIKVSINETLYALLHGKVIN